MDYNKVDLIRQALAARQRAYVPYSRFMVGAALMGADGKVYTGCNIENASFSATVCAERTALFKAVSEGARDFIAIAVVGGMADADGTKEAMPPPCGVCLQALTEFCDPAQFEIICAASEDTFSVYKLKDMLPYAFQKKNFGVQE